MKIRFVLTRWDIFKAKSASLVANRSIAVLLLLVSGFFLSTAFTDNTLEGKSTLYRLLYGGLQIIIVSAFGLTAGTMVNLVQSFTGKGKGILGEHTLEITEDGLVETTAFNSSLHRWSAFHKARRSGGFLWLFVTDTMVHIVPLKRPLLEGDLAVFQSQIETKLKPA